ncbi:MAG: SDR family oxidoreductase [Candidatus Krumholzibacteriia bacterium]
MLKVTPSTEETIWRVEDSLLDLGAVRPLAFFARNAHRYSERWKRVAVLHGMSLLRVFLYATSPVLSSRILHLVTRGMSRDRLDILGEEYFEVFLRPRLKRTGLESLQETVAREGSVVLVSQGLEQIVRPLAKHLGVERFIANRLEFRDGYATGRLLEPVVHSRGGIAGLASRDPHGRVSLERLSADLGLSRETLRRAVLTVELPASRKRRPVVLFDRARRVERLSVRESLAGKHILLIGVTGFIGKVWLAQVLNDLPEIGKIHLLIRPQRTTSARRRFERMVEENPVFHGLHQRYGDELPKFMGERVEVVEGDISRPGLGLDPGTLERLRPKLDVIVNSSGLTNFNPDLRNALAINVDATVHILDFIRSCDHAALLHLSTCFVVGDRDGRIAEDLQPHYVPRSTEGFDAEQERQALHCRIEAAKQWPPDPKLVEELATPVRHPGAHAATAKGDGDDVANRGGRDVADRSGNGGRFGWLRRVLTEAGMHRAHELGWPNTYAFTKSLGESQIERLGADLPLAIVRPSIVESSLEHPFVGWNEGINTSAPLSYLLGTTFRQLPANERKCLDIIPVDLVSRGMTLVVAALVERCHARLYQMATSVSNPCNMKRSIELTSLAHRKHYREQKGNRYWWKARMDAIPVSKQRYQRLSAPRYKAIIGRIRKFLSPTPFKLRALVRAERAVNRVAKLVEIYEPFILENEHVFEADNMRILSAALPPEEREVFAYEAEAFDWRDYWINIHVPAMRKWCYPLIEGRSLQPNPRYGFRLPAPTRATRGASGVVGEAIKTEASWRSS